MEPEQLNNQPFYCVDKNYIYTKLNCANYNFLAKLDGLK